ncbi:hypothetical protein [Halomonas sp. DQ26W]|uniref:hypothetical protein n=1 Tax=Halomonas sp. DQ26W TaxID=2282311 RepID=UPI0011C07D31|nr:hypothetical protein [Halomonas sp. DQ26W]
MSSPIQHTPAPTTASRKLTRLPDREPGEQQHGYPFKPERLPEAPLATPPREEFDEPAAYRGAEGYDELVSQDRNATIADVPS